MRAGVVGGILTLLVAAVGIVVPNAAVAEPVPSVSVVASSTVVTSGAFTATNATATCPTGTTLLGGGDTLTTTEGGAPVSNDGSVTLGVAPNSDTGQPVMSGAADPASWTATGGYSALFPGTDSVTAYAMCASGITSSTVAEVAESTNAGPLTPVTAVCPVGTSLVGGGGGYTSFVASGNNTKLFDSFPSDSAGDFPANSSSDPTAWTVEGNSNIATGAPTTAVALCATDVTLATEVVTSSYESSVNAGGTISATVSCPSDSVLLDGGIDITDNPSKPGTGGQGVHVITDDPGASSGSWMVTAEDGGQNLALLGSTAVALCAQTQVTGTTTTSTPAPTTTSPTPSTSTTLSPTSGVGTSPATGTTTSVPGSSTSTPSGFGSPPSTLGPATAVPATLPRPTGTTAGRTAAATTPATSTPAPAASTTTGAGAAPAKSISKGSGPPGPDTVTGLVVDSTGTVPTAVPTVAPRASTVPRTLLAASGGGLGEGFWIVLVAAACLVIGMLGERSRSLRARTLPSLTGLRRRRRRSRHHGH